MRVLLIVQQGPEAGRSYALDPQRQPVFSVGRAEACEIVVLDPLASRHHCDLQWNGHHWEIVDQRSTGGTLLNGQQLRPLEPYTLQPGDQVALGSSVLALQPAVEPHPIAAAAPLPAENGRRRPLVLILVGVIAVLIIGTAVSAAILLQGPGLTSGTSEATAHVTQVVVVHVTATYTGYPAPTSYPPPPTASPRATHPPVHTNTPAEQVVTRSATTIPASPSPAPTPNVAEAVQAEFERLAEGRILYNPPEEMQVGQRERIEARISMDPLAPLDSDLIGEGVPQVEAIPVSCFMKVRLHGDTFDITALGSEEQVVPPEGYTEWAWDVTPTKAGEQTIFLIVTARVKLSGYADEQKDLDIIERQIHIKVNPGHSLSSFFKDNQEWIYAVIIVPLVAALGRWLWTRYKKRMSSGSKQSEPSGRDAP